MNLTKTITFERECWKQVDFKGVSSKENSEGAKRERNEVNNEHGEGGKDDGTVVKQSTNDLNDKTVPQVTAISKSAIEQTTGESDDPGLWPG